ncbi:hypothetical protein QA640_44660 (plasmid) [Bradyrhizobium sp. CB82]|uniref:hypothetical protein n=1 Tax=Bradyrhizobium sp. CB82 TaxID=3039159 RepID=UPI0024B15BED|nr:hypothetical protein [Bradyrhizobium sp. CB82]WFU45898.1 hypothetical protein QA640_44635 [Bradyrhizobium sp. CB82]WFU45902.1 hypothetical protein QA640_44660 [Bradyrhizobium sp. CB82]
MIRELIDTELEVVAGGFGDVNTLISTIVSHSGNSASGLLNYQPQTATANSVFGPATAVNAGGPQVISNTF